MTNEQLLADLRQKLEAFLPTIALERQRIAVLRTAPGEQITAELKKYAGFTELLAALDEYGRRPDPSTETVYDTIRREATARQHPDTDIPLDERLKRSRG